MGFDIEKLDALPHRLSMRKRITKPDTKYKIVQEYSGYNRNDKCFGIVRRMLPSLVGKNWNEAFSLLSKALKGYLKYNNKEYYIYSAVNSIKVYDDKITVYSRWSNIMEYNSIEDYLKKNSYYRSYSEYYIDPYTNILKHKVFRKDKKIIKDSAHWRKHYESKKSKLVKKQEKSKPKKPIYTLHQHRIHYYEYLKKKEEGFLNTGVKHETRIYNFYSNRAFYFRRDKEKQIEVLLGYSFVSKTVEFKKTVRRNYHYPKSRGGGQNWASIVREKHFITEKVPIVRDTFMSTYNRLRSERRLPYRPKVAFGENGYKFILSKPSNNHNLIDEELEV